MKRYWIAFYVMVCLLAGCQGNKTVESTEETVADTTATVDSTVADNEMKAIEEEPMPKAADELFDDFVFNFAANRKLQYSRIKFPLPVVRGDDIVCLRPYQRKMDDAEDHTHSFA